MGTNRHTGQLKGLFLAGENLVLKMTTDAIATVRYLKHLGVQAPEGSIVVINNNEYKIGKTNIYEIEEINISTLSFKNNIDNAIIDYVIEI